MEVNNLENTLRHGCETDKGKIGSFLHSFNTRNPQFKTSPQQFFHPTFIYCLQLKKKNGILGMARLF